MSEVKSRFARAIILCQKAAAAESLKEAYSLYSKSLTALKEVHPDLPSDIQPQVSEKVSDLPALEQNEELIIVRTDSTVRSTRVRLKEVR